MMLTTTTTTTEVDCCAPRATPGRPRLPATRRKMQVRGKTVLGAPGTFSAPSRRDKQGAISSQLDRDDDNEDDDDNDDDDDDGG